MAASRIHPVLYHLRRSVLLRDGAGMTDAELLESFILRQDESAFEALVRRHGPMVLGVCRRILHHQHDAEDAFQATFLVLVHKAASVVPRTMVGNWLYGVARTTAHRAKAASARRRARERQMVRMTEPAALPQEDPWDQLRPVLDQELAHLPPKYRAPILLCDLGNHTIKEAARQLGWPQGTLAARLARGRAMLAKRVARHGLVLSSASLAVALMRNAASASPSAVLVSRTVGAATCFGAMHAALPAAISARVADLTRGGIEAMLISKLRFVTVAVLAGALLGLGLGAGVYRALAGEQTMPPAESPKKGDGAQKTPDTNQGVRIEKKEPRSFDIQLMVVKIDPKGETLPHRFGLDKYGKGEILSRPELMNREGEVAIINIGHDEPFRQSDGEMGTVPVGISEQVSVSGSKDGNVRVDITAAWSEFQRSDEDFTQFSVRKIHTIVNAKLGEKIVIEDKDQRGEVQGLVLLWVKETKVGSSIVPPLIKTK